MPKTIEEKFAAPLDTDISFPASGAVAPLMPAFGDIPSEFKTWSLKNPFVTLQREWFFNGLKAWPLKPKPGIDRRKAIAHLSAIQASWEPSHEHKVAAVAYLMSLWFEAP